MARSVRRHPDFEADYVAQLNWLVLHKERDWIVNLAKGLREIAVLVGKIPGVGAPMAQDGSRRFRKIIFPKGPYVAWYTYDETDPEGEVWLLRLFHARQARPMARRMLK